MRTPTPVIRRSSSSEFDTPTDGVLDARTTREVVLAVMSLLEDQKLSEKSNFYGLVRTAPYRALHE